MKKQELQIATQKYKNDVVVISLDGFVDGYSYDKLEQTFDRLIKQGIYKFIVDLSRVDYLSSAGVSVFIDVFSITQEKNGYIELVNPKPNVKEVFELLGLTGILSITTRPFGRGSPVRAADLKCSPRSAPALRGEVRQRRQRSGEEEVTK